MRSKSSHISSWMVQVSAVLALCTFSFLSIAQSDDYSYVKNFKARASNGKIFLSWTTKAGFTCQDIGIQVSTDSIYDFQSKGTIYGVCGNTDQEEHYTFVIDDPIPNRTNYIRLTLGNFGFSRVIDVLVISPTTEVLVIPHPVIASSKLYFDNLTNELVELSIITLTGTVVYSTSTQSSEFHIGEINLHKGFLLYKLSGTDIGQITGKIFISH